MASTTSRGGRFAWQMAGTLLGVTLALVAVWWLRASAPSSAHGSVTPSGADQPFEAAGRAAAIVEASSRASRSSAERAAATPITAAEPDPASSTSAASRVPVRVSFVDAVGSMLVLPRVRVRLLSGARLVCEREFEDSAAGTLDAVPCGSYRLEVQADGHRHPGQRVEVAGVPCSLDEPEVAVEVPLWPEGWIPIRITTPEGEAVDTLAARLGIRAEFLFLRAFDFRADASTSGPFGWTIGDGRVGDFLIHDGWRWEIEDGIIGTFVPRRALPVRIGLRVYGKPHAVVLVEAGSTEIMFRLGARDLDKILGSIRFQVVRGALALPAPDARASLAHPDLRLRQPELEDSAADASGRFVLEHLAPGRYELTVRADGAARREWVDVVHGETKDLGLFRLDGASTIPIRVVDEHGVPALAFLETAPLEPGANVEVLAEAPSRMVTDEHGRAELPAMSTRAFVRAVGFEVHGYGDDTPRSECVVLDPARPPAEDWTLVLHPTVAVSYRAYHAGQCAAEFLDANGIVMALQGTNEESPWEVKLVRGQYRLRLLGERRALLAELPFEVRDAPLALELR